MFVPSEISLAAFRGRERRRFWFFLCHGFQRDSARNPPEFVIIADLDARLKVAPPSRYFGHVCVRCVSRCHEQTVAGLLKNTLETLW